MTKPAMGPTVVCVPALLPARYWILLVVGFPAPTQLQAGGLAMKRPG